LQLKLSFKIFGHSLGGRKLNLVGKNDATAACALEVHKGLISQSMDIAISSPITNMNVNSLVHFGRFLCQYLSL